MRPISAHLAELYLICFIYEITSGPVRSHLHSAATFLIRTSMGTGRSAVLTNGDNHHSSVSNEDVIVGCLLVLLSCQPRQS
jgi:hypothetical protein